NNNDVNASVEWLFSHPDDDGVIEENTKPVVNLQDEINQLSAQLQEEADGEPNAQYALKAVICHKGTSPHTGHYVAFIKHEGQWILFNDEKVVSCGTNIEDIKKKWVHILFRKMLAAWSGGGEPVRVKQLVMHIRVNFKAPPRPNI
ncbi:hypothetical protein OXX79_014119, partial [Metschnikowia pulcherrima]